MATRKPIVLYNHRNKPMVLGGPRGNLIDQKRASDVDVPRLDNDHHQNVGAMSRIDLMSFGRALYSNFGPVKYAVNQMAGYAADDYSPTYYGSDLEFRESFQTWLPFHDRHPAVDSKANMQQLRRLIVVAALKDGDVGLVLTELGGRHKLQLIPAHRIGGWNGFLDVITEGQFEGAKLIDGVIVDPGTHRPLGYRVLTGEHWNQDEYVDVPIDSMRLYMSSMDFVGQLRGMSALGGAVFDFHDVYTWQRYELQSQKLGAALSLIRTNADGEADDDDLVENAVNNNCDDDAERADDPFIEEFRGGEVLYIRPKEKVEAFVSDRPKANQREFIKDSIRSALAYMGFSIDFSYDSTKIGGASIRVVADQMRRRIEEIQTTMLEPALRWYYGYAVAKAVKNEVIPKADDMWALRFVGRKHITADKRYDAQVDLMEYSAGYKTLDEVTSNRGTTWIHNNQQRQIEAEDILNRAKVLSEKFQISMQAAIAMLSNPSEASKIQFETNDQEPEKLNDNKESDEDDE